MESEIKEAKEKENLENEMMSLNDFYMLAFNSTETKELLKFIKDSMNEFYLVNCAHYNKMKQIMKKINSERKKQNYANTLFSYLISIIEYIIKIQLKSMEIFISKSEVFFSFENQILKLQKTIEEFSFNFNKDKNKNNSKDANNLLNTLMNKINNLEIKVVDEYIKEKYDIQIPDTNELKTEKIVFEIKFFEKTLNNYINKRKTQYWDSIALFNNKIQLIFEEIKNNIEDYFIGLKEINKNMNEEFLNFENIPNSNIKNEKLEKNNNFISSQFDNTLINNTNKYKIKILKNPNISLNNINEVIKSTEIKNKEPEVNKAFNPKNEVQGFKKPKIFNKKILILDEKDIYEIVSKLYNYNLEFLDKSNYNLEFEKQKLIAKDFSNEIFLYNEDNEDVQNKFKEKYNEIIESINTKILNRIENIEVFFKCLNAYRAKSKLNLPEKFYYLLIYIYNKVQDKLIKNTNKKLEELMLILSQTYFKEINGKKIYLLEAIKTHDLYKNMEFWKSSIIKNIEDDFRKKRVLQSKDKNINIITQEKKEESIINKLLPFFELLKGYGVAKDKINELFTQILDKYACSEKTREKLFSFINENA